MMSLTVVSPDGISEEMREENKKSAQRIVDAVMKEVEKQLSECFEPKPIAEIIPQSLLDDIDNGLIKSQEEYKARVEEAMLKIKDYVFNR